MHKRDLFAKIWIVTALLFSHFFVLAEQTGSGRLICVGLLAVALVLKMREMVPIGLLLLLMVCSPLYFPDVFWNFPSLPFLIPFVLMAIVILPFRDLRTGLSWFRRGQIDQTTSFLIVAVAGISTVALICWGLWSDNLGFAVSMARSLRIYPSAVVFGLVVPLFALINAFSEEVVYRGVFQDALGKAFGSEHWLTLLLQASAFAAAHVAGGFPNGKFGFVMVLVYGLMLGYLRVRAKGMLVPYLAHVAADLAIGYFLSVRFLIV